MDDKYNLAFTFANEILIETDRLILRPFSKKDVDRIHMAWSNPQSYRYNSIDWDRDAVEELVGAELPTDYGMYLLVAELKQNVGKLKKGQIVATCRFGSPGFPENNNEHWGFGYCVFRSDDKLDYTLEDIRQTYKQDGLTRDDLYQGHQFGQEMLEAIIFEAKNLGVKYIEDGADINNHGSLKVMIKNGFVHKMEMDKEGNLIDVDEDCDFTYTLDLTKPTQELTKEEISSRWEQHLKLVDKNNKLYKAEKEELDKKHYLKSVLYLMFSRLKKNKTKTAKEEVVSIFKQLNKDEIENLLLVMKERKDVWKEYNNTEYLNLLNIVESIMDEMQVISEEE